MGEQQKRKKERVKKEIEVIIKNKQEETGIRRPILRVIVDGRVEIGLLGELNEDDFTILRNKRDLYSEVSGAGGRLVVLFEGVENLKVLSDEDVVDIIDSFRKAPLCS